MCGSGTALLESILQNRHTIGVDIDPIAKMISKVKTTPIEPDLLDKAKEKLPVIINNKIKSKKSQRYLNLITEINGLSLLYWKNLE